MARMLKSSPETAAVPIIFCTAKDTEDDTVAGLNIGADDYIAKPFSVREVLARVRSVLRRTAPQEGQSRAIAFEGLHMDLVRKICTVDGTPLALTKKSSRYSPCCFRTAAESFRARRYCIRSGATR